MSRSEHFTTSQTEPTNRFKKGIAAFGIAAAGLIPVACASSEAAPVKSERVVAANVDAGATGGSEIVHGECSDRSDIYSVGTLSLVDEDTGLLSEVYMNDIQNRIFFTDGSENSTSSVEIKPESYPKNILDQIRKGVRELSSDDAGVPGVAYLLGEKDSNQDDFDGKLNDNINGACVDWA